MAITLDGLELPIGLRWTDEFSWSPVERSTTYSLDGSLIIQESVKLKGRPITLSGGINYSPIPRDDLLTLYEKLTTYPETGMTLILHDTRQFQVMPHEHFVSEIYPVVMDSGPADPLAADLYYIENLYFIEV